MCSCWAILSSSDDRQPRDGSHFDVDVDACERALDALVRSFQQASSSSLVRSSCTRFGSRPTVAAIARMDEASDNVCGTILKPCSAGPAPTRAGPPARQSRPSRGWSWTDRWAPLSWLRPESGAWGQLPIGSPFWQREPMNGARISATRKPVGRPKTGLGVQIGMRWHASILSGIDEWRRVQPEISSPTEAIRRLVELGLAKGRAR